MTKLSKKVTESLSEVKKSLFYKNPMGDDTLFGDYKVQLENGNECNIPSSNFMREKTLLGVRNVLFLRRDDLCHSHRGSPLVDEHDVQRDYPSYSRRGYPLSRRSFPLVDEHDVRPDYHSHSRRGSPLVDEHDVQRDCPSHPRRGYPLSRRGFPLVDEPDVRRDYPSHSRRGSPLVDEHHVRRDYPSHSRRGSPLVDEHHVRPEYPYPSYFSFSFQNGERASTTTPSVFTTASFPASLPRSSSGPISNSNLRTCDICAEERRPSDFPTTPITSTCTHPVTDACKECVRRHLASQLSSRGTTALNCICNQPLSLNDVQRNADPRDFTRYSERATMELLESDSQFIWCPAQGCGAGQIQQRGSDEPKVTCAQCRQPYCFTHRVRWHAGMTCREFDQNPELADAVRERENAQTYAHRQQKKSLDRSNQQLRALEAAAVERRKREAQEQENESYVRRTARPCPNCKYMTQKDGGCKHVTCIKCQFEFCWQCKKAWTAGHLSQACVEGILV